MRESEAVESDGAKLAELCSLLQDTAAAATGPGARELTVGHIIVWVSL